MASVLPNELMLNVLSFLNWKQRLDCSLVSKRFKHLVDEPSYWRSQVEQVFRVPRKELSQPNESQEHFKLLVTARLYTWGDATGNRLGFSELVGNHEEHGVRGVSLPTEVESMRGHTVVDLKMGGSATYVLNSAGQVYCSGTDSRGYSMNNFTEPLSMPPVCQISASLEYMLALSDHGEIYFFHGLGYGILPVQFSNIATIKHDPKKRDIIKRHGAVTKIMSGMMYNSAFVEGYGIVVWNQNDEKMILTEKVNTVQEIVIPGTAGLSEPGSDLFTRDGAGFRMGDIRDYAMLRKHVVFVTEDGKVYTCEIPDRDKEIVAPVRLFAFEAPQGVSPIVYISGSYSRFAVHSRSGLVFMGLETMLVEALRNNDPSRPEVQPLVIPELQNLGVVQMAAGDTHWLARTKDYRIFSLGVEAEHCGCLGLGGERQSARRGVVPAEKTENGHRNHTGNLVAEKPLEVFFGVQPFTPNTLAYKGYLEMDGENYKAFTVAAGGWHSGALVFITEPKKDKGKRKENEEIMNIEMEDLTGNQYGYPKTMEEHGHWDRIMHIQSAVTGISGGLWTQYKEKGPRSTFGLDGSEEPHEYVHEKSQKVSSTSAAQSKASGNSGGDERAREEQNFEQKIKPPNEHGHRDGIVGMESAAKGMRGSLSSQSMAAGGKSAFNFNPNATSFTMSGHSSGRNTRPELPKKGGVRRRKAEDNVPRKHE